MCLLCFLFGFALGQPDHPPPTPQQELTHYLDPSRRGQCYCPWDTKRYYWGSSCGTPYCSYLEKALQNRTMKESAFGG